MWLVIALLGFGCGAVVNILDKFILSTKKIAPSVFVFYSTAVLLPLLIAAPFFAPWRAVASLAPIMFLGALAFFGALYCMYRAELASEISHVGPLLGAIVPVAVLFLSGIFLGEVLTARQFGAAALLILGSLIISFEVSREHYGWQSNLLWAVFAGGCFAIFHVVSKYTYSQIGFMPGLLWIWGLISLPGLCLLATPAVRQAMFGKTAPPTANPPASPEFQRGESTRQGPARPDDSGRSGRLWVLVNKILGVASTLLVQYAIALGSVALVNALAGVQYALLIILVAVLSKFFPRIIKETYARGEAWQEGVAVGLIALGLATLLF